VLEASAGPITVSGESFEAALSARREAILADMARVLGAFATVPQWAERLVDSFVAEIEGKSPGVFLATLDELLRQVAVAGGDVAAWQGALSALRRQILSCLGDNEARSRAENLWQQARVLVGQEALRTQLYQQLQAEKQTQTLDEVGQALSTTFDVAELTNVLAKALPRLGIRGSYLSVYENPKSPAEWSRLILAYDERGRIELEANGRRFRSRQLVPEGLLPIDRRYSMIVEPLYFREDQLGFLLSEAGAGEEKVPETLRGQISSALKGARLVQQVERHALQLQTAAEVSRVASSTLDPNEVTQQIVDLTRERFGLYYVGLFLLDEDGHYAVLRAGTGEAGQKMLAAGHKLEVGGTSMVGQCVAHMQARIALDVGAETVRFGNPLLPETRSEMALPLFSRGEAIGALTIQSGREAAFDNEDIAVLQTMANQMANAIQNARLFERTQAALKETETTHRRYLRQEWSGYLQSAKTSYETVRLGTTSLGDMVLPEVQQAVAQQSALVLAGNGERETIHHSALVAPITLRGEVIGALGIHDDGARQWTPEEVALVEAVVERMALAAENLRLLDETQRRAARERLLNEITARIRAATTLEGVLNSAVREISQVTGANYAAINLELEEAH
jgi:GAF domain-containing protein